jgi:hypothetical protein
MLIKKLYILLQILFLLILINNFIQTIISFFYDVCKVGFCNKRNLNYNFDFFIDEIILNASLADP